MTIYDDRTLQVFVTMSPELSHVLEKYKIVPFSSPVIMCNLHQSGLLFVLPIYFPLFTLASFGFSALAGITQE